MQPRMPPTFELVLTARASDASGGRSPEATAPLTDGQDSSPLTVEHCRECHVESGIAPRHVSAGDPSGDLVELDRCHYSFIESPVHCVRVHAAVFARPRSRPGFSEGVA